ncbi:hypothetical protein BG006_004640 [Podila minutissima]|uniref:F-box domain-containing protein n=1 Tax=Podila minutissima TaxID=64525 RepID=A0A9P5SLV8_9FUNG|nr:hypothetical protein BG006_004640 [Podila minutissima]
MPSMDRTHPLDILEILSLIGSFVPAWQDSTTGFEFAPRNLLSCALVARLGAKRCYPTSGQFTTTTPWSRHTYPTEFSFSTCTRLKFFLLTASTSFQTQVQLLYKNPGVESLHWLGLQPVKLPGRLVDLVQPFAGSIKYLRLEKGKYSELELIQLLNCFPNLRRLHISRATRRMINQPTTNVIRAQDGLQITGLKSLTIESCFDKDEYGTIVSILSRNPGIDYIDLNILVPDRTSVPTSLLDTLFDLRKQVLDHRDQEHSPQGQAQGPKELRFRVTRSDRMISQCNMDFENQGKDVVALSAILYKQDVDALFPRLSTYADLLYRLNIECHWPRDEHSDIDVLRDVLRHFSALRHLRFISHNGLRNEDSSEVFQVPKDCGHNSHTSINTAGSNAGDLVWACQDFLEHLELGGLWKTAETHRGQGDWEFTAASQRYQWVACDNVGFGMDFRNVIAQRVQTLPRLRALTLQGVIFDYRQIVNSTSLSS